MALRLVLLDITFQKFLKLENELNLFILPYLCRKLFLFKFKNVSFSSSRASYLDSCVIQVFNKQVSNSCYTNFLIVFITSKKNYGNPFLKGVFSDFKDTKKLDYPVQSFSHDLRSSLFNLQSYLEIIYEYRYKLHENQYLNFLETLNTEVSRITLLTSKLLETSCIQDGNILFSSENTDFLFPLIKSYKLNSLQKNLFLYPINIIFSNQIKCDSNLIHQVLSNFISNSIRFTRFGGKLLLKCNSGFIFDLVDRDEYFFLRIIFLDNGIGIPRLVSTLTSLEMCMHNLHQNRIGSSIVNKFLHFHITNNRFYGFSYRGTITFFNLTF
jgi:hypothetical protein